MDLFLMDLILKGKIPVEGRVLDAGCGEGRNAVYFIQEGRNYLGVDADESKIRLAQFMSNNISTSRACFLVNDIQNIEDGEFDLILCSRVLHFSESIQDFMNTWEKLSSLLTNRGVIYISMDSTIENTLGKERDDGKYEFPDGAVRFSLTEELYDEIKKGFAEIEPLKTLIQNKVRAQSFFALRKN